MSNNTSKSFLNSYVTKLLLMVIGLVVVIQVSTYLAARAVIRSAEVKDGRHTLTIGGDIFTELLFNRGTQLQQSTAVLVSDFGFREAIATGDTNTIHSALKNHAARIGAEYAAVITQSGITVNLDGASADPDPVFMQRENSAAMQVRLLNGQPYEVVITSINAPQPIGAASMGFALNSAIAEDMKQLTGLEVSFVSPRLAGTPAYIASTLPQDLAKRLPTLLEQKTTTTGAQLRELGEDEMLTLSWRLDQGDAPIYAVLQIPMSKVLEPYQILSRNLLWLNLIGILVAVIIAAMLARDVTRPIRALVNAARRITSGDYNDDVIVDSNDEFSELATAFTTMQSAISDREQRILQQSRQDPLTGLGNRSTARSSMIKAIRQASAISGKCAALTIDLRRFKEVNDVFGHQAGDNLLQVVALRLLGSVKERDHVIRLGADVFMVVLEEVDASYALKISQRICSALQQSVDLQDLNLSVNAHIGIAVFPDHGSESEELMRRSDIAMHVAKETGAQISLYQPGSDELHLRRLGLLRDLKEALVSDGLTMHYQPKAALADNAYIGAEALMRWHHPIFGNLNPEEFISIAESAGYINQLTRWMLNQTMRQLGQWHAGGLNVSLSVNISAHDLTDKELPSYLSDLLVRYDVNPGHLCLELTESSIMQDEQQALTMLNRLKSMGVRLSIDDFGTGFSSLSQLKRMPVDELKIDKSFILKLDQNDDDAVIVRSTIELGHNMGLSVVAEGVENGVSLGLLGQYGCDMIQGYFLAKPMAAEELGEWVDRRRSAAADEKN